MSAAKSNSRHIVGTIAAIGYQLGGLLESQVYFLDQTVYSLVVHYSALCGLLII